MKNYFVYILTDNTNGTLYIGITNDLKRRIAEHKEGVVRGFTQKYGLKKLVYLEQFANSYDAISREKQLKHWNRIWKVQLIEKNNPTWHDLYEKYFDINDQEFFSWIRGREIYKK